MAAPATCTISGTVYQGATGQAGALVRWRVVSDAPPVTAGDGQASGDPTIAYSGSDGSWTITVPQGLVVWLEIPALGIDHVLTVPSVSTATRDDLALSRRTV